MALTRKFLAALGIDADKIDEIINAHTETTGALKDEIARVKADADKLPEVQRELDALKQEAEKYGGKNPFEVKYNALKEDFDKYKADVQAEKTTASKRSAYRALLKDAGISEKRIDAVLKVSDVDGVELDEAGGIKGREALLDAVKNEWADFIVTESTKGANTPTPPAGNTPDYDSMSDADYYKATYEAEKKKG